MYKLEERINTILELLRSYIFQAEIEELPVMYLDDGSTTPDEVMEKKSHWKTYKKDSMWGGKHHDTWFIVHISIPEPLKGKELALEIEMQENQKWQNYRPQFMAYVDNQAIQGIDINHRFLFLNPYQKKGEFDVLLNGYAGEEDLFWWFGFRIVRYESSIEKLYYNLKVMYDISLELSDENLQKHEDISFLNQILNHLYLAEPFSDEFYRSIGDAINISEKFYKEETDDLPKALCVGHTHIDVAWLWRIQETRKKAGRSFATVLTLMEEFPDYYFLSSQPVLYEFVKQDYPELYQRIKEKIASRQWEAEGAMYLESDCNLTSGESLVRQILYGKKFFKEEFDVDNHIIWLPDVFGYNGNMPQIAAKSGIDFFVTSKISWNQYNKMPHDLFYWKGIDGTSLATAFITTPELAFPKDSFFTTYNGILNAESVMGAWERFQDKEISDAVIIPYGYGDGGGGTTREMILYGQRLKSGKWGVPKVSFTSLNEYASYSLDKLSMAKYPPVWQGELYLELHRGTYTANGTIKRNNRKAEYLFHNIEFLSVVTECIKDISYPDKEIEKFYKILLMQQFHDILPGSAIEEVYEDSEKTFHEIFHWGNRMLEDSLNSLVSKKEGFITVWNTTSSECSGIVNLPNSDECIWVSKVPAYGCLIVNDSPKYAEEQNTLINFNEYTFETPFYLIRMTENGQFSSIYDKKYEREIILKDGKGNRLTAYEDFPYEYDNWELSPYYKQKSYEIKDVISIKVTENNNTRGVISIRLKFLHSEICQDIIFYYNDRRIDFKTKIDWHEKHLFLKSEFPVDINGEEATYDIAFGNIKRPTHSNTSWDFAKYEVCTNKWADLSESGYGVALLNDCKYGCDIHENKMTISLIKSGTYPNPNSDQGRHYFSYSLLPHSACTYKEIDQQAEQLNNPFLVVPGAFITGLDKWSFVSCTNPNIKIVTVKKAETEEAFIIRLHEINNARGEGVLSIPLKIKNAAECNLLEENDIKLKISEEGIHFSFRPYEIKTIKIFP